MCVVVYNNRGVVSQFKLELDGARLAQHQAKEELVATWQETEQLWGEVHKSGEVIFVKDQELVAMYSAFNR